MNNNLSLNEYLNLFLKYNFIHEIWKYEIELLKKEINEDDEYLKLFAIYFSLVEDGNICMSLDKNILYKKWNEKVEGTRIIYESKSDYNEDDFNIIQSESNKAIENCLDKVCKLSIINSNNFFVIDNNWLYINRYYYSRLSLIDSINRLFKNNNRSSKGFDYKKCVDSNFSLSLGQEEAVIKGISRNLIITGGPGTGKTTSILFLLINLLEDDINQNIYLTAPSGKASARMKESILNGLSQIKDEYKNNNKEIIKKIENLDGMTIHRLLAIDSNGIFNYNKDHQFEKNSIFVIDEASMIDVNIFACLLSAIPTESRVYIMGDKNQLPSVECGAVFGDLLANANLKENIIALDESKRFKKGSPIYMLAESINNGKYLNISDDLWQDYNNFEVKDENIKTYPIYYYRDCKENKIDKEIYDYIVDKWQIAFYKDLKLDAMNIDLNELDALFKKSERAKILCAENEGCRGVKYINKLIRKMNNSNRQMNSYSPGEIVMINTNNRLLDLNNGDSGIIVKLNNDNTLYLMLKKESVIVSKEGYVKDAIFKIKDFMFYPIRLIPSMQIDLAYAITIHKSQGSDYENILVILPKNKNHPLLNRQIVYTAITRTKGRTFIVSNNEVLNKASRTLLVRDTNLV